VLPEIGGVVDEMLAAEFLFDEQLLVVAAPPNPWTNRRRIDLAELADELWAVPVPDLAPGIIFSNHFRARGLSVPSRAVVSDSVHLRARLVATGLYLSVLPESMLRFGLIGHGIKALPLAPLDDPVRYEILTVKNRTISPAAALFIENLRGAAGSLVPTPRRQREKASGRPGRG
jgi:DNA-binding transcriptional LysR family regulator